MVCSEVEIVNRLGLHARAAAKLVTVASAYKSNVQLQRGKRSVNGKSIMGVMMLAAGKGSSIEIMVEGDDEEDALAEIVALVAHGFGEES